MKNRNAEPILSAKNIVNRFGDQLIHDHVDLDIHKGEIIGIVGGSGSGKSVLLRTILGLNQPSEGTVKIGGKKLSEITPEESAALYGVLFQQGALFSSQTVSQNIMMPLREHIKIPHKQLKLIAQLKLAMVGLSPETGTKLPSELSGGMIKRAALARALAMDPQILFLDEPTAGLDPVAANEFDELIVKLNKSLGVTVVMVTHDLDTLFSICTRIAVLVDKKITIDTLPNLLKSKHPWIREYFHGPRARAAIKATETANENKLVDRDGK